MRMSVQAVASAVEGQLIADEDSKRKELTGITWDSRKLSEGDIFLAMPGERVDGNDFIVKAIGAGAGMVICTRKPSDAVMALAGEFVCPLLVVEDGIQAISSLASAWRDHLRCMVIGVTGSTGKTSTKDLLASVLGQRYVTVATLGNNNNELGVPYTVLRAQEDTEVLIVEMGMRGLGQVEASCAIAKPGVAVITNVGVCHMELLGSRENIARAKGELIGALGPSGMAAVNGDDDMTPFMLDEYGVSAGKEPRVIRFGHGVDCEVRASDENVGPDGCVSFMLHLRGEEPMPVTVGIPGKHNVMNAMAAAAVGRYLGVPAELVVKGLQEARGSAMRMEVADAHGITVINDAYNANPDSMKSALATLGTMECTGRRVACLGDMGELGEDEEELHAQVGRQAAASGIDALACVGKLGRVIMEAAREAGMSPDVLAWFPTVEQAAESLKGCLKRGDVLLVKASRFMGLEKIVEEIAK